MNLHAGASALSITPSSSQPLDGYPHGERLSKGVDTELFTSALFLDDGVCRQLIIGNDLLFVSKDQVACLRGRLAPLTGVPEANILISSTHTHSAPVSRRKYPRPPGDPTPDPAYVDWMLDRIVQNAAAACAAAQPAEIAHALADSSQVGGNRRDPLGPSHPEVPVLIVRSAETHVPIAMMLVVSVHPTVLHEDSKLVSGDFLGHARLVLQQALGDIPVVFHNGPSGNQSPRHFTTSNTVAEARRLGTLLAESILGATVSPTFESAVRVASASQELDLPLKNSPTVEVAERGEREAFARFEALRLSKGNCPETRTAECDWFGTERVLAMAKLHASGEFAKRAREIALPAEISALRIGRRTYVTWPGEVFVEFALKLKSMHPETFVITCANGTTQGYLVTAEAVAEGGYEASSAAFLSPESPEILLNASSELLARSEIAG